VQNIQIWGNSGCTFDTTIATRYKMTFMTEEDLTKH